jgi:gas vesicle protein
MERDGIANFFLGLGIGVGLGMLFAPKSGDETRDLLMSKADEGKEYLKKQTSTWKDSANDLIDKGKEVVNRQKDNLNDAVEAGKQAYRDKVEPNIPSEARS